MSCVSELPVCANQPSVMNELQVARTVDEAASLLRVCRTTVRNLCTSKKLKTFRVGKRILIPASSIESLLSE